VKKDTNSKQHQWIIAILVTVALAFISGAFYIGGLDQKIVNLKSSQVKFEKNIDLKFEKVGVKLDNIGTDINELSIQLGIEKSKQSIPKRNNKDREKILIGEYRGDYYGKN